MDAFLRREPGHRRDVLTEAGRRMGLQAASIEKDFWVCWTLRALFALPVIGEQLTFKGGTSLSKGWKLIDRFSEDIDVVIGREHLGFGGDSSPEAAASRKERQRRIDALVARSQASVRELLLPSLARHLEETLAGLEGWSIELDPDADDQQCVLLHYPSVVDASRYLKPIVRIELGARSDTEPHENPEIVPYAAEQLPDQFADARFSVRAVSPERTFLEKLSLLHEESFSEATPRNRLARHYYDLFKLIQAGVGDRAMADAGLFERVVQHRRTFFKKGGEAQTTLARGTIRVVPTGDRRSAWNKDYEAMREAMFFDEPPSFDEILEVVEAFEQRFNAAPE